MQLSGFAFTVWYDNSLSLDLLPESRPCAQSLVKRNGKSIILISTLLCARVISRPPGFNPVLTGMSQPRCSRFSPIDNVYVYYARRRAAASRKVLEGSTVVSSRWFWKAEECARTFWKAEECARRFLNVCAYIF